MWSPTTMCFPEWESESETLYWAHLATEINTYTNWTLKRPWAGRLPLRLTQAVVIMGATLLDENKHNVVSDYKIQP